MDEDEKVSLINMQTQGGAIDLECTGHEISNLEKEKPATMKLESI